MLQFSFSKTVLGATDGRQGAVQRQMWREKKNDPGGINTSGRWMDSIMAVLTSYGFLYLLPRGRVISGASSISSTIVPSAGQRMA